MTSDSRTRRIKPAVGVAAGLISGAGLTALKWSWIPGTQTKFIVMAISFAALGCWMWADDIIGWRFRRAAFRQRSRRQAQGMPALTEPAASDYDPNADRARGDHDAAQGSAPGSSVE